MVVTRTSVVIVVALLSTGVQSWPHSHAGIDGTRNHQRIDALFADFVGDRSGASALVIKDGLPYYEKSFGMADLESQVAATPRTNYRLASVSKAFTAFAILILRERGQLTLGTRLRDIIEFPDYGDQITVRHLLNHTSGLRDYENHIPPGQREQLSDRDVVDILRGQRSLYFAAGTQYRYSNSGYATLAEIVSSLSGLSFAEFLNQEIFQPLGMSATVAYEKGISSVSNRAFGYTLTSAGHRRTDQSLTSAVLGDGGVYISLSDQARWDRALYRNSLIRPESLTEAFTAGRLANGQATSYGFGWMLSSYKGMRKIHHTVSTIGFRSAIQRYPEKGLTVIVLINRENTSPWSLADRITEIVWD